MQKRFVLMILVLLMSLSLSVFSTPVTAQHETHPLLEMLAMIPDNATARSERGYAVGYADYEAIITTAGFEVPTGTMGVRELDYPFLPVMGRLYTGMDASYFVLQVEGMPQLVGFGRYDIKRSMVYGEPPNVGEILAVDYNAERIETALSARDFEKRDVDSITVWHRFEDLKINIQAREPADPFGGPLGASARVALMPNGYIVNTRTWGFMENSISAAQDKSESLADADDYRILAEAITSDRVFKGSLLQAQFLTSKVFEETDPTAIKPPLDISNYGDLPEYSLVVIADRQDGNMQVNLIGVLYADEATAKTASIELHKRISSFDLGGRFEFVKATMNNPQIYVDETTGQAVVLISVSYPLPSFEPEPQSGLVTTTGHIVKMWINAISRRQFVPLAQLP